MDKTERKISLARQFGVLFLLFALVTTAISGYVIYREMTETYHRECVNDLKKFTTHVTGLMQKDGNDMALLKKVIATGYKAEQMFENESPLVRAVKCKNKAALSLMLESGFTEYIWISVPGWDDIGQITIDEWQKRK